MKLEFDPVADAAYFEISNAEIVITREIESGVMGDYDAKGHLVGIEVLSVKRLGAVEALRRPVMEALPLAERPVQRVYRITTLK